MARRKKGVNYNFILIVLGLAAGVWFAADFYFNVYRHPQKEVAVEQVATTTAPSEKSATTSEAAAPVLENGFKNETWRDARLGIEFQYPVFAAGDQGCPKLEKTDGGFSLGIFYFLESAARGSLADFVDGQLMGMTVDSRADISVAGKPAKKIDYETAGMGFSGSAVFLENGEKFYEFGFLANESSTECGGIDDYEDRVYQSVISTLKFTN